MLPAGQAHGQPAAAPSCLLAALCPGEKEGKAEKVGENGGCHLAALLLLIIGLPLRDGERGLRPSGVVIPRGTSSSLGLHPQAHLVPCDEEQCEWQRKQGEY